MFSGRSGSQDLLALGREAATERAHQVDVETQSAGLQFGLAALGGDQPILGDEYVEVSRKTPLIALVDGLVCVLRGIDARGRGVELRGQGLATRRSVRYFAQSVGERRVVVGDSAIVVGARTAQRPLQAPRIEDRQRNRRTRAPEIGAGLGQVRNAERLDTGKSDQVDAGIEPGLLLINAPG